MMNMNPPAPIAVLQPDWQGLPSQVKAFATLRSGGVSTGVYGGPAGLNGLNLGDHVGDDPLAVEANRQRVNALLPSDVIFLSQVHGTLVVDGAQLRPGVCADAVVTSMPGVVCAVLTADCLPVLFCDAEGRVVGAAHAGWRGLAAGILENTVNEMRSRGAQNISAWMGAAIGPQKFEVGQDVYDVFTAQDGEAARFFVKISSNDVNGLQQKYVADIYQLARLALSKVGVVNVVGGEYCTVSDAQKFYSYRRDKETGRMASLIWIEPTA